MMDEEDPLEEAIQDEADEPVHPAAFDIREVRILLMDGRNDLYILLGCNEMGQVGGWWRRSIEPRDTLRVLHKMLEVGELEEGWERGRPPGQEMTKRAFA